ncbi:MAG TPA: NADH-quinone oxidoreductase subunit NuoB [Bdellovibrionota bacterium]|nr:NADH-quinone oxidoreductase subunit NuoB [Bdellovibrionota bacterium]
MSAFYLSSLSNVLKWATSHSLWYSATGGGCCADELLNTVGARYDLERFGCLSQVDPRQSDLLIVSGMVSYKAAPYLKAVYEQMLAPKYVLSLGSCANCGGPFSPDTSYSVVPGVDQILPVDVYVAGCPPRPEAIMNGLIALQEKIRGKKRAELSI